MKILINTSDYYKTIKIAQTLHHDYDKSVIFHSYWYGDLIEKHFYSILSCYYFNVHNKNHKIILWLENNMPNHFNTLIENYAEIRFFSLDSEKNNSIFLEKYNYRFLSIAYYADFIRNLLLYNYGGVWFDLDCFFLRSFDPLFYYFKDEIILYHWENKQYANNAIYISLEPKSKKMKKNMEFIMERNLGWGFQEANLTYDLPLDMLLLPCSWFDGGWIQNPYKIGLDNFFEYTNKKYDFLNFFAGSFCYHWHNKWNHNIDENSICMQLIELIKKKLALQ